VARPESWPERLTGGLFRRDAGPASRIPQDFLKPLSELLKHPSAKLAAAVKAARGTAKHGPMVGESLEAAEDELDVRVTGLFAALALYKKRHGAFPARLDQLVPDLLPAVPNDPYTDRPCVTTAPVTDSRVERRTGLEGRCGQARSAIVVVGFRTKGDDYVFSYPPEWRQLIFMEPMTRLPPLHRAANRGDVAEVERC